MEITDKHDGLLASFVRGDFNASSKNKTRAALLSAVIVRLKLSKVNIDFPTYHHFTGNGLHDSDLDLLLFGGKDVSEVLVDTVCKLEYPLIFSHHDILISPVPSLLISLQCMTNPKTLLPQGSRILALQQSGVMRVLQSMLMYSPPSSPR